MSITINGLQTQTTSGSSATRATNAATDKASKTTGSNDEAVNGDRVTLGTAAQESLTYGDPRTKSVPPSEELQSMLEESDRKAQQIIDLIVSMVKGQGTTLREVISGEAKLQADPETIEAAKEAISEDGEFGVAKTSQRILDFARAMIGDDPSRIDAVRAGVEKGFAQATAALGGKLPEISEKTYEAIMAEFDRWQKEGLPTVAESETSPA